MFGLTLLLVGLLLLVLCFGFCLGLAVVVRSLDFLVGLLGALGCRLWFVC